MYAVTPRSIRVFVVTGPIEATVDSLRASIPERVTKFFAVDELVNVMK